MTKNFYLAPLHINSLREVETYRSASFRVYVAGTLASVNAAAIKLQDDADRMTFGTGEMREARIGSNRNGVYVEIGVDFPAQGLSVKGADRLKLAANGFEFKQRDNY